MDRLDDWELTWPIWHMLPRLEKKDIAFQHGFKTIGEFEEYMSLLKATSQSRQVPYPDERMYRSEDHSENGAIGNPVQSLKSESDQDDEVVENGQDSLVDDDEEKIDLDYCKGGLIMELLPPEIFPNIFACLPVDAYATLALVSPHWKSITSSEAAYHQLCRRIYLQQCKRKCLNVPNFQNSYHKMLHHRPRVRAGGGGLYIMKISRIKNIRRDMWTEVSTIDRLE